MCPFLIQLPEQNNFNYKKLLVLNCFQPSKTSDHLNQVKLEIVSLDQVF
jgi:hypothetical protein